MRAGEGVEPVLRPNGRPILKPAWCLPAMLLLSEGKWFSFYQDSALYRTGEHGILKLFLSAAWAAVQGLVESDADGWLRIMPLGRAWLSAHPCDRPGRVGGG